MFISFSRNFFWRINRLIISKNTCRALSCRRSYFSFSLIDRNFPNLNRLPFNYSTAAIQVEELPKAKNPKFKNTIVEYYRELLENSQDYRGCLFCLETVKNENQNSSNKSLLASRKLLEDFKENISSINEDRLIQYKNLLNEEVKSLSFYELVEATHNVCNCLVEDVNNNRTFRGGLFKIATILDNESRNQLYNFSVDQKIFLADLWCRFHKIAFNVLESCCMHKVKLKLFDYLPSLSKTQMVMFFYLVSATRSAPKTTNDFAKYSQVEKYLPVFTIEEIGLICYALHVIDRYPIKLNGATYIIDRISREVHSCSHRSWAYISLILNKISHEEHSSSLHSLQKTVADTSEKFSLSTLLNILAITVDRFLSADESLLEATLKRTKENIQDVSFQNLLKLLNLLSILNIRDEELLQLIAGKLRSEKDFHSYNYTGVLRQLIIFNVYLEDVFSEILNEEFYKEELKSIYPHLIKYDLFFMETSMRIERPHAKFSRLPELRRKKCAMKMMWKEGAERLYQTGSATYLLEESLARVYGPEKCFVYNRVTPHFYTSTIVLKLDKNFKGREVPDSWRAGVFLEDIIRPLDNDHYWLVLYFLKRFFFTKNHDLNATAACMKRQIEALGFIPVPIFTSSFVYLKSDSERDQVVEDLIKEAIAKLISENIDVINNNK